MGKVGGERDGTSSNIVQLLALKHTKNTTHPLIGPLSGTTRVSRYRKGKTNLDFTEARDSEWQWQQLGHMQVCISLQTDNHASTPLLIFYRLDVQKQKQQKYKPDDVCKEDSTLNALRYA